MVKRYVLRRNPITGGHYMAEDDETSGRPLFVKSDDYECLKIELAGSQERTKLLLDAKNHWLEKATDLAEICKGLEAALHEARRAIGDHHAPNDCYATGPLTGNEYLDLVQCPACAFIKTHEHLSGITRDNE